MIMSGKLIVIEGTDGSGKETQSNLLHEYLKKNNIESTLVHFPNYDSPASSLVKMYLAGEFGDNANQVNPYAASVFYACDRFASWKMQWQEDYHSGKIIIADRYVMSNLIHQASKFAEHKEKEQFQNWLENLEYQIFGLPKPDKVLFLHVDIEKTFELMRDRENKITQSQQKDIHERDRAYMRKSYETANYFAIQEGWSKIECMRDDVMKSKHEIHTEIIQLLNGEGVL